MEIRISWTADKISTMKDLWEKGMSISDIGTHFGVSRSVISGVMNRNRDLFPKKALSKVTRKRRNWSAVELAEMAELYKQGMLLEHIGKRFNVSDTTITGIISRHRDLFPQRVTPRSNYSRKNPLHDERIRTAKDTDMDNMLSLDTYEKPQKNSAYSRVRETEVSESSYEDTKTYNFYSKASRSQKQVLSFPKAIPKDTLPEYYRDHFDGNPIPGYGIELVMLDNNKCRNPIVEDENTVGRFRFCGAPRNPLYPYCNKCARLMYKVGIAA